MTPDSTKDSPKLQPVKVKICGITNFEDAFQAASAGADYLGFIFYPPGKRSITPEVARQIIRKLQDRIQPVPSLIGVFVDEDADTMAKVLDLCQLDLAQLSGSEVPALIGDPESPIYRRSLKAIRPTSLAEAEADAEWYTPPDPLPGQPSLLLDAYHPALPGGTGQKADWSIAAKLATNLPTLMLAGGLNPQNVQAAITQVHPFAVDVASGVELFPGRKDHDLVSAFITAAKSTFSTNQQPVPGVQ
jgi:phosphoribosylanthranilate isomerase